MSCRLCAGRTWTAAWTVPSDCHTEVRRSGKLPSSVCARPPWRRSSSSTTAAASRRVSSNSCISSCHSAGTLSFLHSGLNAEYVRPPLSGLECAPVHTSGWPLTLEAHAVCSQSQPTVVISCSVSVGSPVTDVHAMLTGQQSGPLNGASDLSRIQCRVQGVDPVAGLPHLMALQVKGKCIIEVGTGEQCTAWRLHAHAEVWWTV